MTFPYDFGSSGFSMPSASSWSLPSASSWSLPSSSSGGILGGAGQGWDLPSWGGSSGGSSSFPSLSSLGLGGSSNGSSGYPDLGSIFGGGSSGGSSGASTGLGFPTSSGSSDPFAGLFGGGGTSAASGGGFQSGGILGGAGQSSTPSWTSLFSGGGASTPSAGGASGAAGGFQMPGGFGQGIFGVNPTAQSPTYTSGGSQPAATTPSAGNGAIKSTWVPQHDTTGKSEGAFGTPGASGTYADGTKWTTNTAKDAYGNDFNYVDNADGKGGTVSGLSSKGTVMKTIQSGDGKMVTYDTGIQPQSQRPTTSAPKQTSAPPPAVVRGNLPAGGADTIAKNRQPTISTPAPAPVARPAQPQPQPAQPSQPSAADVEKQRRDSGYYLQ